MTDTIFYIFPTIIKLIAYAYHHDIKCEPPYVAMMRAFRSLKLFLYPSVIARLLNNKAYQQHVKKLDEHDPFFFISHRTCLASGLPSFKRIKSTVNHYAFETEKFNNRYLNELDNQGLYLWMLDFEGVRFDLRLAHGNDVLNEGASSIVFYQNNERICVISFSIVQANDFLTASVRSKYAIAENDNILLITRKQPTSDYSYQKVFNKVFDRTTPAHLCMGALAGYAQVLGFQYAIGISAESHPSLQAEYQHAFNAAYDDFWMSLSGQKESLYGYLFSFPLKLSCLDDLDAKARKRAIARREHAQQVALQSASAIQNYLKSAVP